MPFSVLSSPSIHRGWETDGQRLRLAAGSACPITGELTGLVYGSYESSGSRAFDRLYLSPMRSHEGSHDGVLNLLDRPFFSPDELCRRRPFNRPCVPTPCSARLNLGTTAPRMLGRNDPLHVYRAINLIAENLQGEEC